MLQEQDTTKVTIYLDNIQHFVPRDGDTVATSIQNGIQRIYPDLEVVVREVDVPVRHVVRLEDVPRTVDRHELQRIRRNVFNVAIFGHLHTLVWFWKHPEEW